MKLLMFKMCSRPNDAPITFFIFTANALGYYRNSRTEDGIDPNRDFPYDLLDPSLCMRTIAGRTLNEVFREHLFQMALTFHGGLEVVAYEWGAPSWYGFLSPDDLAQNQIAQAYSNYAGSWPGGKPYAYGSMNDLVYYIRGGMEDWAYAGSWDKERVRSCEPTTFNGYPVEKTVYNNSTLRVFNMLVETSDSKNPIFNLGRSDDLLNQGNVNSFDSGHIPRNIRLSLLSADLVEPYVSIVQVNDVMLPHDVIPLSSSCGTTTIAVNATGTLNKLDVSFSVGGALSIDQVQLWFANNNDIVSTASSDCRAQPTFADLQSFTQASIVGPSSGSGHFSSSGSIPATNTGEIITDGPLFSGTIDIPKGVSELIVMASARVDQDWKIAPNQAGPDIQPQSHMANVRTDLNWRHEREGKVVQGRLDWFSQPLTVVVAGADDTGSTVPTNAPTMTSTSAAPTITSSGAPSMSSSSMQSLIPSISSDRQSTKPSVHPSPKPSIRPTDGLLSDSPALRPSLSSQVPSRLGEDKSSDPTNALPPMIPINDDGSGTETTNPPAGTIDEESSSVMVFVSSSIIIIISLVGAFAI